MELHGTRDDGSVPLEFDGVDKLREVTFILTSDEMETMAKFFAACAAGASEDNEWEHEHLQDYLWEKKYQGPDVVIYRK